ncbi:hypothetical protein [Flavobacterium sp.]|uniref:hypothetical protein n=1 Tax=Flavobacterium sp. TaxID=239 RepID=UPI00260F340D|nr:hypothetical protein [Flavobacterium sp.]
MEYYRIEEKPSKVGTVIDTDKKFDLLRIERLKQLEKLFNLIFEISSNLNLPLINILATLYPKLYYSEIIIKNQSDLEKHLDVLRKEILYSRFNVQFEFRNFTDFIFSKARADIIKNHKISLPDRFKSRYFFESIEDCLNYHDNLISQKPCKIIMVEFIDKNRVYKFDNTFLTSFENHYTSEDFYRHANDYWMQQTSQNPLFEIIFLGKYKVKAHVLEL